LYVYCGAVMQRRDVLKLGIGGALAGSVVPRSLAQASYPDRVIRLMVPFPPGGVYDAVARPWADKMKSSLGSIVVENMGGAGGSLATVMVARAQPDGYTILLGGGLMVINFIASTRAAFNPLTDFAPIYLLAVTGAAIVVNPALPVHNVRELVEYARANPGKLSYGSPGTGSANHLAGELFKSLADAPHIVHVPYRGAGPAMSDLISGHIPMATPNVSINVLELHRSGKVRMLAVTTPNRLAAAPEIPTAVESGMPDMIAQNFLGLFAPAGTPRAIIDQISGASRTALADPEFQRALVTAGTDPVLDSGPEKTRRFVEEEIARWTPIIKAVGLKVE
jgi:tripartite-type tricarboxylate transporter receptor subunit TctC